MPLTLLPNVFSDEQPANGMLPEGLPDIINSLQGLIAESERAGRRYLVKIAPKNEWARSMPILLMNEHTPASEIEDLAQRIRKGEHWGLVSDAGLPCIADPGSQLVLKLNQQPAAPVHVIPGPTSIIMALMLSGFSGQRFSFHGYLPKGEEERIHMLRKIEEESYANQETHIWIETPYRNKAIVEACTRALKPSTFFAAASNISFPNQRVLSMPIHSWHKISPEEIEKIEGPTVFLLFASEKTNSRHEKKGDAPSKGHAFGGDRRKKERKSFPRR